jgi:hypothetical protein
MVRPHSKETKNSMNLCAYKDDFVVDAEWPYSAVAYGRSACDGTGVQLRV